MAHGTYMRYAIGKALRLEPEERLYAVPVAYMVKGE